MRHPENALERYQMQLREEYDRRFPRSRERLQRNADRLLDQTSHAIRGNDPFMPLVRRARGAEIEDLDGHHLIDYWQGHFTNLLGHNPAIIRETLAAALAEGRGLQSGMVHELELELAERICDLTACETLRFTTSGSLATFYAVLLARAHSRRDLVLKVSGGWHGSQPFGLKGVTVQGRSFDHLESEGLSASTSAEVVLTRFNDTTDLQRIFRRLGDRLACFLVEPILGAGGGMVAGADYLREARQLTERHGTVLVCDEIITGFRFHGGSLCSRLGVQPDLLVLGKVLGGGMPVAAVAGRRDLLGLAGRGSHRVKFEGGTFSAHELALIASRALLDHLERHGDEIYPRLGRLGDRMRTGLRRTSEKIGVPLFLFGETPPDLPRSSLVLLAVAGAAAPLPACPEELLERAHPHVTERLLKSTLLLESLSTRSGIGAISAAHDDAHVDRTIEAFAAACERLQRAGLL